MKSVFTLSRDLLLRTILVCLLSFMAFITLCTIGAKDGVINPVMAVVFGIIYLLVLLYFFIFTAWTEGGKDYNRVGIGQSSEMLWKGFAAAAIVVVPVIAIFFITALFPGNQSLFMNVLNIIKFIFMWNGIYLTVPLTAHASADLTSTEQFTVDAQTSMVVTLVLSSVYIISFIGSGIGYIFGYKRISFIPAIISKLLGKDKKEK